MFRLTFTLAAALYAGFVIWGDPTAIATDAEGEAPTLTMAASAEGANFDRPVILETNASSRAQVARDDSALPDAAFIAASAPAPRSYDEPRLIGAPTRISLTAPAIEAAPALEVAVVSDTGLDERMKVSGSRVNLRSGPSTGNGVIDSLVRGTVVEQLGDPGNGWVELRDVSTGVTGYMAARFLEPA